MPSGIAAALPQSNATAQAAGQSYVAKGDELSKQMSAGIKSAMSDMQDREKKADDLEASLDPNALKPPHLEPPPAEKETDPIKAWGSAAMVVASLGGLFTRQPLTTSLNAAAGVMNAYKQRDAVAAQQAFESWKVANQNAIDAAKWSVDAYKDALEQIKSDRDAGKAELLAVAAALKDNTIPYMLQHYGVDAVARLVGDQDKAVGTMVSHQAAIETEHDRAQLYLNLHNAHADYQKAVQSQNPQAIADAKAELAQSAQDVQDFNSIYAPARSAAAQQSPAEKAKLTRLKDTFDKATSTYNSLSGNPTSDPKAVAAAKTAVDHAQQAYEAATGGGEAKGVTVDMIHKGGAGTSKAAPAKPQSQAEFDRLPGGAWFVNPADGQVLQKK